MHSLKTRIAVALLALIIFTGSGPALAYVVCYEEHYGGDICATTCVFYDDETGAYQGYIRGPFHEC